MIELKLRQIGNSLGAVPPKEAVARLNAGDGERLYLSAAPEGGYRLTPCDPALALKMTAEDDAHLLFGAMLLQL
jgi:antitoxin component of MazEF toxin-antitoxin module